MSKPAYRVLSMKEIDEIPWNGFNVVSTFSGCGGSSLGYKMAGFKVAWASEFIQSAQETYRANHSGTILDCRDIRTVKAEEVLAAMNMKPGELDILDGSPPCASFSTAGKRESGWGTIKKYSDKKQRTDDLFFEFIRLLKGIKPKVFVAENVSGLVKGTAKGYFLEILAAMKASGYRVTCRVLDAQWLGVPQQRQRTIFIGVRENLNIDPAHPKPLKYRYSVRDAVSDAITVNRHGGDYVSASSQSSPSIMSGDAKRKDTAQFSAGGWITTATGKRKFTIAELRRICAFPDDFILHGSYEQQWERLGRAVPPVMMSHIAKTIRDEILLKVQQ